MKDLDKYNKAIKFKSKRDSIVYLDKDSKIFWISKELCRGSKPNLTMINYSNIDKKYEDILSKATMTLFPGEPACFYDENDLFLISFKYTWENQFSKEKYEPSKITLGNLIFLPEDLI